ncbi:hypothetical protein C8J57DRAFT_1464407 [Mycena rebaudengoi]|nr:hypothetical protein C8J57DRAFT_1464407 [Mycena rebaudengoi]
MQPMPSGVPTPPALPVSGHPAVPQTPQLQQGNVLPYPPSQPRLPLRSQATSSPLSRMQPIPSSSVPEQRRSLRPVNLQAQAKYPGFSGSSTLVPIFPPPTADTMTDWFHTLSPTQQAALLASLSPFVGGIEGGVPSDGRDFYQDHNPIQRFPELFQMPSSTVGADEGKIFPAFLIVINFAPGADQFDNDEDGSPDDPWDDQPEEEQDKDEPQPATVRDVQPPYQMLRPKRKRAGTQSVDASVPSSSPSPAMATASSVAAVGAEGNPASAPKPTSSVDLPTPPKKRRQKSRSIAAVASEHRVIVEAAYDYLRMLLTHNGPFPHMDKQRGGPRHSETGTGVLDRTLLTAWDQACTELEAGDVNHDDEDLKLIRSRISQFRAAIKKIAQALVPEAFKLADVNKLENPPAESIAALLTANRLIIQEIKKTFYYTDPRNTSIPNTLFRHAIIQSMLNAGWFGSKENDRAYYFKGRTMVELVTMALILAAVCSSIIHTIDEWVTGRHVAVNFDHKKYYPEFQKYLAGLERWQKFSDDAAEKHHTRNLAVEARTELLRNAWLVSAKDEEPLKDSEEDDMFSDAALAANYAVAPVALPSNKWQQNRRLSSIATGHFPDEATKCIMILSTDMNMIQPSPILPLQMTSEALGKLRKSLLLLYNTPITSVHGGTFIAGNVNTIQRHGEADIEAGNLDWAAQWRDHLEMDLFDVSFTVEAVQRLNTLWESPQSDDEESYWLNRLSFMALSGELASSYIQTLQRSWLEETDRETRAAVQFFRMLHQKMPGTFDADLAALLESPPRLCGTVPAAPLSSRDTEEIVEYSTQIGARKRTT